MADAYDIHALFAFKIVHLWNDKSISRVAMAMDKKKEVVSSEFVPLDKAGEEVKAQKNKVCWQDNAQRAESFPVSLTEQCYPVQ